MTQVTRWAVIENAGYRGERVVNDRMTTHSAAIKLMQDLYDPDEIEDLHVDIAHWDEEGEFWSYDH